MLIHGDHPLIPEPVEPLVISSISYNSLQKETRIGSGGDADVYRTTIPEINRQVSVALKEPRIEGTLHKDELEQFTNEADNWARLDGHANVVHVYDWETRPVPWIALEYMDAGNIDALLGEIEIEQALWLGGRIAEGVWHGHQHGIAHLDIKPANVLLRSTTGDTWPYPKIGDWGLAKLLLDHSSSVEGISPEYAAPEQFDPETYGNPDQVTDIYQFGSTLYALLTGEPPFVGPATDVMHSILNDEPARPSTANDSIPAEVDRLLLKTLSKDKADRYEAMLDVRREFDRLFEKYALEGTTAEASAPATSGPVDEEESSTASTEPASTESSTGRNSRTQHDSRQSAVEETTGEGTRSRRSVLKTVGGIGALGLTGAVISEQAGLTSLLPNGQNALQPGGDAPQTTPNSGDGSPDPTTQSGEDTTTEEGPDGTATQTADATDGTTTTGGFADGFEDGELSGWTPLELNDNATSESDNEWSLTEDAIAGSYSLFVQTQGDHLENIIATDQRVLDMTRNFTLSFTWRTSDPDQRGPMLQAVKKDGSDLTNIANEEISEKVFQKNTIGVWFDAAAISRAGSPYKGKLTFSGDSTSRPSYAAGTTHSLTIEKTNDRATLSVDGSEMITTSVLTEGQYRIALSASGTWGYQSDMKFDDITIEY